MALLLRNIMGKFLRILSSITISTIIIKKTALVLFDDEWIVSACRFESPERVWLYPTLPDKVTFVILQKPFSSICNLTRTTKTLFVDPQHDVYYFNTKLSRNVRELMACLNVLIENGFHIFNIINLWWCNMDICIWAFPWALIV